MNCIYANSFWCKHVFWHKNIFSTDILRVFAAKNVWTVTPYIYRGFSFALAIFTVNSCPECQPVQDAKSKWYQGENASHCVCVIRRARLWPFGAPRLMKLWGPLRWSHPLTHPSWIFFTHDIQTWTGAQWFTARAPNWGPLSQIRGHKQGPLFYNWVFRFLGLLF